MWMKLTGHDSGDPILVNSDRITTIVQRDEGGTFVDVDESDGPFIVNESVEQLETLLAAIDVAGYCKRLAERKQKS